MILAWIITFSLILLCLSATVLIMNGVKQTDEQELADLHINIKNIAVKTNFKKVS
ncbi:hypothetical protein IMZ08_05965 [Bacillus luteolus]|uniref:ATP synthase F0 subunit 8 n=1 Tax=Litchfieldia luteola TaxID=682179 RepID=A0ABR9QGJ7_9BACI|nr:hypothetical protein [Cytobacillus luteolus]MBE4907609.1 hypothetical protein [Cytobacillus luteolus]MBP1944384.1 hypothetical protein [Cytobacillus luteolus]